ANLSRHGEGLPTVLLAEMPGERVLAVAGRGYSAWRGCDAREPSSLVLGHRLLVIAGHQIVTSERIEVLAIACIENIADGLTLDATITAVRDAGAIPVLPWGVGKGSGERGRFVANAAARPRVLL